MRAASGSRNLQQVRRCRPLEPRPLSRCADLAGELRVPFGQGSGLWGDSGDPDAQIAAFLAYVTGTDAKAFQKAKNAVSKQLRLRGRWTRAKSGNDRRNPRRFDPPARAAAA